MNSSHKKRKSNVEDREGGGKYRVGDGEVVARYREVVVVVLVSGWNVVVDGVVG